MARTISEIKKVVMDLLVLLEQKGIHAERVILYGSYATDRADENSDIDIVIISPDLERYSLPERLELLSVVSWKLPAPLEIIGYTPAEVSGKEGKSIFWDEILSTGKIIYEAA